ncbi:hypothetical protein FWC31_03785 [Candidatus Saccharibacteria bacterium]|nr:hypothetical protein [Candidatus Saccharibacteria bacterium]
MSNKPIIAVDIDDVLTVLAPKIIEYSNKNLGCNLTLDDYDDWWAKMWGVDVDETIRRAQMIFADPEIYPNLSVMRGAQSALDKLTTRYKIVVLTSRPLFILDTTTTWINRNFPMIEEIFLSGNYDNPDRHSGKRNKGDIVKEIGAMYFIDDQPKHTNAAAERGIESILFGDYGWNRDVEIAPGVTRVADWGGVADYFGV